MSFGETITSLRKGKGMTQEQLAEQLGVTRQTISKWELDQSTPDLNYIGQLSELFEVTTDYLIKGEQVKSEETEKCLEKETEEEKQIIYVEKQSASFSNVLSSKNIVGIIISILGAALVLIGIIKISDEQGWLLGVILGIIFIIIGVEILLSKKHPVLNVFWTIWIVVFIFCFFFMANMRAGFNINTVGGIMTMALVVYLVVLIIMTIRVCKNRKN